MAKGLFWKMSVPAGGSLLATVRPTDHPENVNAELYLRKSTGQLAARFDKAELLAGVTQKLAGAAPTHYWGQLVLSFTGAASARVEITVTKPGGGVHGNKYVELHTGRSPEAIAVALFMA